jgi:hypothetical protein
VVPVQSLAHVLLIGGPPATGKTTVATHLARRHGLRWYCADTRTWEHRDRALAAGVPGAQRWEMRTPRERTEVASSDELLAMSLHRERGPMVVDDLRALPRSPSTVAEGSVVPAAAVSAGIADASRAVWLLPTREFQEARLAERGSSDHVRQVFTLFADVIRREAEEHGVPTLTIDGSTGVEEVVTALEERFAAALAEGPRASGRAERRVLLREANVAIVGQVRGFFARPWADGDSESVVRSFLCECGDRECTASVEATVGGADAGPVLAPGHG